MKEGTFANIFSLYVTIVLIIAGLYWLQHPTYIPIPLFMWPTYILAIGYYLILLNGEWGETWLEITFEEEKQE